VAAFSVIFLKKPVRRRELRIPNILSRLRILRSVAGAKNGAGVAGGLLAALGVVPDPRVVLGEGGRVVAIGEGQPTRQDVRGHDHPGAHAAHGGAVTGVSE